MQFCSLIYIFCFWCVFYRMHFYLKYISVTVIAVCIYFLSVYAIGDCIAGPMLAHKAEDEG